MTFLFKNRPKVKLILAQRKVDSKSKTVVFISEKNCSYSGAYDQHLGVAANTGVQIFTRVKGNQCGGGPRSHQTLTTAFFTFTLTRNKLDKFRDKIFTNFTRDR